MGGLWEVWPIESESNSTVQLVRELVYRALENVNHHVEVLFTEDASYFQPDLLLKSNNSQQSSQAQRPAGKKQTYSKDMDLSTGDQQMDAFYNRQATNMEELKEKAEVLGDLFDESNEIVDEVGTDPR